MTNPTTTADQVDPPAEKPYVLVTWQTVENHSARLTAARLAELLQVSPDKVKAAGADDDLDNGLPVWVLGDGLAEVEGEGDTFDGCTRENIELRLLCERCEEPSDDLDTASGLCSSCRANNASRVVL